MQNRFYVESNNNFISEAFLMSQNSAQAHTPYLSSTPQMCTIQLSFWEIIRRQVTNCSIGISPPQGTPPAAPLGYRSIIIPCIFYRPPPVVIRLHSKYRIIAPPKKRWIFAHLLNLACLLIANQCR